MLSISPEVKSKGEEHMREIIEKIIDGCTEVKKNPDIHKDAKSLASFVIKDCNDALKKEWVGLTDDEREEAVWESGKDGLTSNRYDVALAIEAKLKEKNI
jgi:hypothetical protein